MSAPRIRVRIQRLVLEGVEAGDGGAVAQVFKAELARRLATGGLPSLLANAGDHASLPAPAVRLDPTSPDAVGRRVAAAVDAGMRT